MFTAEKARELYRRNWDETIERAVRAAGRAGSAYVAIHSLDNADSRPFEERIDECAAALTERGFSVNVRDRNSIRFAEVCFTWGEDNGQG